MNQNLDWANLPFGYMKTNYNVRCYYRNGKWGEIEVSSSEYVSVHMAATGLHYGQQSFEGLKAFRGKDGDIRVFRWEENAKRLRNSAHGIMMAEVPDELFKKVMDKVIALNAEFVPPSESGAALYIRPLLFGSGAEVGVKPSEQYTFLMFVTPVGPYFKEGFKPVNMLVTREYDRAAPLGTGHLKVGGNYAASLRSIEKSHNLGYSNVLYLDAKEKKYIDECGPANFFGIKGNTYITPKSNSILPSITNMSLIQIAQDIGLKVERRPVLADELPDFDEVGACGTAAVISPIGEIYDPEKNQKYNYCKDGKPGEISTKLYNKLRDIQYGQEEDIHNWVTVIDC